MLFLDSVTDMPFAESRQNWNEGLKVVQTIDCLADVDHHVQSMLLETLAFIDVWFVFEWEQLESLRSDFKDPFEEHLSDILEPQSNNFGPRFLSEPDGPCHTLVLDILAFLSFLQDLFHLVVVDRVFDILFGIGWAAIRILDRLTNLIVGFGSFVGLGGIGNLVSVVCLALWVSSINLELLLSVLIVLIVVCLDNRCDLGCFGISIFVIS